MSFIGNSTAISQSPRCGLLTLHVPQRVKRVDPDSLLDGPDKLLWAVRDKTLACTLLDLKEKVR